MCESCDNSNNSWNIIADDVMWMETFHWGLADSGQMQQRSRDRKLCRRKSEGTNGNLLLGANSSCWCTQELNHSSTVNLSRDDVSGWCQGCSLIMVCVFMCVYVCVCVCLLPCVCVCGLWSWRWTGGECKNSRGERADDHWVSNATFDTSVEVHASIFSITSPLYLAERTLLCCCLQNHKTLFLLLF